MIHFKGVVINTENRIVYQLETIADEQAIFDLVGIDDPRWYPITGGYMVCNSYATTMQDMLQTNRGHGFCFMGKNHWSDAIFLRNGEQNTLETFITIGDSINLEQFEAQDALNDLDYYEWVSEEIRFIPQVGYNSDYDESLNKE